MVSVYKSYGINNDQSVTFHNMSSGIYNHHKPFQVREHAAAVLAGLMKGGGDYLVDDFRSRAYGQANLVLNKRKQRLFSCLDFTYAMLFIDFPPIPGIAYH